MSYLKCMMCKQQKEIKHHMFCSTDCAKRFARDRKGRCRRCNRTPDYNKAVILDYCTHHSHYNLDRMIDLVARYKQQAWYYRYVKSRDDTKRVRDFEVKCTQLEKRIKEDQDNINKKTAENLQLSLHNTILQGVLQQRPVFRPEYPEYELPPPTEEE